MMKWKLFIMLLGLISFVAVNDTQKAEGLDQEVVIQHRTISAPKKKQHYTAQEIKSIKAAKDVVKKYWVSSFEEIYDLLSIKYKERLRKTQHIANAKDYKNSMPVTERVWLKQTYQRVHLEGKNFMKIVVLSEWEEEGYEGIMTFNFDMVKEGDIWQIENIMF